ncbi:MAG TPA: TetR/AcrR family transcriptional regulator [Actinomycetota bacterium]|jgi:AcrR family transcriptional regulator|nr:TetR/AcrR family transcriptional regulator [Actinomycetota bacterium]
MATALTAPRAGDHRLRLLEGMAAAVNEKGYAATTIADVARHSRVSKRTFYEHFADREACFLACYAHGGELALGAVAAAAGRGGPWPERVRAATRAYLAVLGTHPALTRTLLVEVHAAGLRALALRRAVLGQFAGLLCELVEAGRRDHPRLPELTPAMSTALVGGINELVLSTVEEDGADRLDQLEETIVSFVESVLHHGEGLGAEDG